MNFKKILCGFMSAVFLCSAWSVLPASAEDTTPVSYTHLDVYKRQNVDITSYRAFLHLTV